MTAFSQLKQADGTLVDFEPKAQPPAKRPSRWSIANWPVRWKVFAIVLVPLVLAGAFGGLRIYSSATEAADLRRAADRAEMVPAIESYMASLDGAMLASSTGGDTQAALTKFDTSRQELQRRLADTDIAPDVSKGINTMIGAGQALMDKVTANSIGLRDRVQAYTPILLTAEDAINGSVRVDDERIRAETLGLSRAVGARGQMMIQQLLVNLGGELPDPELRMSMNTVAGTEPSTLFGMSQVLGRRLARGPEAAGRVRQADGDHVRPGRRAGQQPGPERIHSGHQPDRGQDRRRHVHRGDRRGGEARPRRSAPPRSETSAIVIGAMLLALLLVILVARSLVRPLRRLRDSALRVAHDDLAREIERVRAGAEPGPVQPIPVHTSEEVGQVAHAVDELHEQAVLLAGEQSRLQLQVSDMFETLSRRSRSLVDQQLSLIDRLERNEEDPERLESLFRLDHLAARMRRNGANLLVLAGAKVPREQAEPVPVSAIINAAASEVEDYTRVVTATVPDSEIHGAIAGDLVHLLAELLDNALRYSPPISQVRVSAVHTGNGGLVIEVSDIGIGMTEADLRVANTRLQSGGEVNPYTARHMGLFVVGRLAAQHGLVVRLRSTIAGEPNSGTTAGVFVPSELLVGAGAPDQFGGARVRHTRRCPRRASTPRWRWMRITTTPTTSISRARSTSTATPRCPSRCCRSAIPAPAESPTSRPRWPSPRPNSRRRSGPPRSCGPRTRCRRRRPSPPLGSRPRAATATPRGRPCPDEHVGVLRVPRAGRQQRRARAPPVAEPQPQAPRSPSSRSRRAGASRAARHAVDEPSPDGRCRRRDLPEDAVRVARRSHRTGQERRPELGIGVGSRLVSGRGSGGRAGRGAHRGGSAGA